MKHMKHVAQAAALIILISLVSACEPPAAHEQAADQTANEAANSMPTPPQACSADPSWISNPNPPAEIPGGGTNFCEFYQFSWQWLLYLMSPSTADSNLRNLEVVANYPILKASGDSCAADAPRAPVLFVRTMKDPNDQQAFVLPERIGQAGGGATIYDGNGIVVFYSIVFGRDLCTAPHTGDLPDDTTEIKMAWRVIDSSMKNDYVWIEADVIPEDGRAIKETLGLIGLHLVRGTAKHHELVWASFEHKHNLPDCLDPEPEPSTGWSFLSSTCAACLNSPSQTCFDTCSFNIAKKQSSLKGTPTQICRVFNDGTAPGDNKGEEDTTDIDQLNTQLVGRDGYLTTLPPENRLQVLSNYRSIGALWENDPQQPSSVLDNQRGSLQLANPVMETTFQGTLSVGNSGIEASTSGVVNCFGCHNYTPGDSTQKLSHIFDDIDVGQRLTGGEQD